MIHNKNTSWTQQLSATLILLILIAIFSLVIITPAYRQWHDNKNEIQDLKDKLAHYSRLEAEKERLKTYIGRIRSSSSKQEGFLPTKVTSIAAADLQRQIISLVEEVGGQILSSQTINENTDVPYERISLNFRIKIAVADIVELLYQLESSTPYLFIDEIRINKGRGAALGRVTENELDVSFKISGYMQSQT